VLSLKSRLATCFAEVFPKLDRDLVESASIENVAEWDSFAAITLLAVIEEEFQVAIPPEQLPELGSFRAVHDYLAAASGIARELDG
jgi:acyl carrier protein